MKTKQIFLFQCLIGMTLWFGVAVLSAAPLTWFPGPAMDYPGSEATS